MSPVVPTEQEYASQRQQGDPPSKVLPGPWGARRPTQTPKTPTVGPWGRTPADDQSTRLRQSLRAGEQQTPDSAARILSMQDRTGLPRDVIARNLDEVERSASEDGFDAEAFRRTNPAVAKWMGDNPDHASLARDDLDQLGFIEGKLRAVSRGITTGRQTAELGEIGTLARAARGVENLDPSLRRRVGELQQEISREPAGGSFFEGMLFRSAQIIAQMIEGAPYIIAAGAGGAATGAIAGGIAGSPAPVVGNVVGALAGAGTGFALGAASAVGFHSFVVEGGQHYLDLSQVRGENGEALSEASKQASSVAVGVLNSALEVVGFSAIASPFVKAAKRSVATIAKEALVKPTMRTALENFGKAYTLALAGETGTEVVQELTAIVGEELSKMASDGQFATIMRDPDQRVMAVQRLADIATQTAQGMLLIGLPGASVSLASDVVTARRAQQREQFYLALGEGVKDSKTFQRLPDAVQDIVARATRDGPMENVYVDVAPFQEYFQSKGVDPREAARELWGSTTEYDQAIASAGALAMPTARYARVLAPTEHNAFFSRELRRTPDEINAREADELLASAEKAAKEATTETTPEDAAAGITSRVAQQITETGMFAGPDADALASQMGAFFAAQGERYGIDPTALFNRYGLQVAAGVAAQRPTMRNVPRPDPVAIRAKADANVARIMAEVAPESDLASFTEEDADVEVSALARPRTKAGRLKNLAKATDEELENEYQILIDANAVEITAPSSIEDDDQGRQWVGIKPAAMKALGRVAARAKSIAKVQAELESRGADLTDAYMRAWDRAANLDPTSFAFSQAVKAKLLPSLFGGANLFGEAQTVGETQTGQREAAAPEAAGAPQLPGAIAADEMSARRDELGAPKSGAEQTATPDQTTLFQRAQSVTETAAFKEWFRDSKVVDENGDPQVLYHQTSRAAEEAIRREGFDLSKGRARLSDEGVPDGIFLKPTLNDIGVGTAKQEDIAQIPLFAKMERPLLVEDREALARWLERDGEYEALASATRRHDLEQSKVYDAWEKSERAAGSSKRPRDDATWEAHMDEAQRRLDAWKAGNEALATRARARATQVLRAAGFDGVILSRDAGGFNRTVKTYVVFDPKQVKSAVDNRGTFDPASSNILEQRQSSGPLGRITFGKDRQFNIELLEHADFSTFLHESGHFYLEVLGDLAEAAPESEAAKDYAMLLKALGVESRDQITVEHHEKMARLTEAYFMEGKAPSMSLRRVFHRFRVWLKALYATIRSLDVTLTNDVREVFDRMFATDAEIEAAQNEGQVVPVFTDAETAGMSETEFAAYRQTIEDAHILAGDKVRVKMMREYLREQEAWWKEARATIRAEVETEVNQEPVYVALAMLQRGTLPDGAPVDNAFKLSKESIVAAKGKDFLKRLPRPYVYSAEGGIAIDQAAELLGFSSGDELLNAIVTAPKRDQVIDGETDARLKAKYGDMQRDGTITDDAQEAVFGEHRDAVVRAELKALNKKAREVKPFVQAERTEQAEKRAEGRQVLGGVPSAEVLSRLAADRIATLPVRHIKPFVYWVAARKASRAAIEALGKQDYVTAANAKQAELLNLALYREAVRVKEDVDKIADYGRSFQKPATRRRIGKAGQEYLAAIDGILDRFDFANLSLTAIDRRASLAAFIKSQEAKGLPVNISEDMQNEAFRRPWKDLSYEELVGVRDVLKHIAHLAGLKNRLLSTQQARDLAEAVNAVVGSIVEHSRGAKSRELETRLPTDAAARAIDGFFAAHRKLSSLTREMDGFTDGGSVWDAIVRPINAAQDAKSVMVAQITEKLQALFTGAYSKEELVAMYRKTAEPALGTSLSKQARLLMALNWGNEDNRTKLVAGLNVSLGREVTEGDVDAVLDGLDARDWAFVQSVWTYIDSFWPDIKQLAEDMDGIAPERVTAIPVQTRHGEFAGGYFPLKYDDRQSRIAHRNVVAKVADLMKRGAAVRASTKAGARQERVSNVRLPVRLDFGVVFEHFEEIAQDLTHTRALIDVNRVVGTDEVESAVRDHYGDVVYKKILAALESVAVGDAPAMDAFDKSLNWIRYGTSIAGLGWNLVTSMLQPLGLTQSIVRVGPKWIGRGVARFLGDAAHMENSAKWVMAKSSMMTNRVKTQQREISEIRNTIGDARGRIGTYVDLGISKATLEKIDLNDVQDSFFWFITRMQLVVDIPTWIGAYEKAMASPLVDEATAIAQADQAVIDSQGSGSIKDLASVQRGGAGRKLFTNFYSFFNTTWNLHVEAVKKTDFKNPVSLGRLAADLALLSIVPAALGMFVRELARGRDDDDDLAERLIREELAYLVNMLVGVRELGGVIQGYFGYSGPAGTRLFSETSRLVTQVMQAESDRALWRALNSSAGILFHYPAGQVQRSVEGFTAFMEGQTHNPAALLFGPPR